MRRLSGCDGISRQVSQTGFDLVESAGQSPCNPADYGARDVRARRVPLVSLGPVNGISAAAVARSRTLGEARWSPGGTRLAWLEAFGGRVDLVVAPADASGPAVTVTAEFPVTPLGAYGGGGYCWVDDDTLVYAAADGRLLVVPATGGAVRVLSRDGHAAAPAVAPGGRPGRVRARTRRRVRRRGRRARRRRVAATRVARRLRVGSLVVGRRPHARVARVGPPEHAVGRLPHHDDSRSTVTTTRAGWREVTTSRSASRGSRRSTTASRSSPRPTAGCACGSRRTPAAGDAHLLLDEPHEHAEPSWGPGQRSFAWSPDGRSIALNRNEQGFGRLVVVPLDGGAPADVSRGWHAGLDWGRPGVAVHPLGRSYRTAAHRARAVHRWRRGCLPAEPRLRGAPGELDAVDLPEPTPVTWPGADGATVHGLLWLPPDAGADAGNGRRCWSTSTADRPTRAPSTGSRVSATSCRAVGRC